jgi:Methionine synthase I (cobalamin-dependent), methyltransferase domain
MKDFLKEIENKVLIYDGSKGYMMQKLGLKGGECGELWNVSNRDAVKEVHRQYKEAGSDVIQTNTFTGSRVHLEKYSLGDRTYELNYEGAKLAREVAGEEIFVAASIGPTGLMFEPYGELTFERAYEIYKEQIKAVADGGVDIINFETFTDLAEMRAALLAAKENSMLPVICSMAFEATGRTLMGSEPYIVVKTLLSLGADIVGANCSFGAEHMLKIVEDMYEAGGGLLSVKPNAGMPEVMDDKVCYKQSAEEFAQLVSAYVKYGAGLVGGCCGTTPEFIKAVKAKLVDIKPSNIKKTENSIITSSVRYLPVSGLNMCKIGRLEIASEGDDYSYIENMVQDMSTEGYEAVLIDMNTTGLDKDILSKVVGIAQTYIKSPLLIKTDDPAELEKALRIYKGVAGVIAAEQVDGDGSQINEIAGRYGSIIVNSIS